MLYSWTVFPDDFNTTFLAETSSSHHLHTNLTSTDNTEQTDAVFGAT